MQLVRCLSPLLRRDLHPCLAVSTVDIQRQCALFLASHLEPSNCLGIYCFADLHNCSRLKQAGRRQMSGANADLINASLLALSFIWTHFAAVILSEEFLTLKANEVEDLIQSDEIEVGCVDHRQADRQRSSFRSLTKKLSTTA